MLEELRITGLGVIDDAVLDLHPGLTAITGETGAGKTMVVAGLSLLFGGRADAGRVRPGSGRAVVEGLLRLHDSAGNAGRGSGAGVGGSVNRAGDDSNAARRSGAAAAAARALEAGAELDQDGSLMLSRAVTSEGRSRAHVGGRSVPISVLAEIGARIVAVHGQSDQLRLLHPAEQRNALDRYAGAEHDKLLTRYRQAYEEWRLADTELTELRRTERERRQQADLLRLGLAEVDAVQPVSGEEEALRDEARRLEHAESLRQAASAAHQALAGEADDPTGGGDAGALLGEARRLLEAEAAVDPQLGELARRIEEAAALVGEVAMELSGHLDQLDADPARLAAVHERRAALRSLTRKYAEDLDGVLAWAEQARASLADLDTSDETIAALEQTRDRQAAEAAELAAQLTESRQRAAAEFGAEVTRELTGLAMPHAKVVAHVAPLPASKTSTALQVGGERIPVTADGGDEVELQLVANPGAPALPLQRGASGGELSRVMLAVEVVFAGVGGPPTLVFDEVDAGVGGRAAVEVGRRLARLARRHQVIVVTHLPQVAAFADRHLLVAKDSAGAVTTSGVRVAEDAERSRELARMLAGMPDSDLGMAHAEELLAVAEQEKRSSAGM
ncbi:MAG: DNA repair protein RecN [Micromonosporaceae bacterium]